MKKTLTLFIFILFTTIGFSQDFFSKSYGEKSSTAILFLHGGPGYNSVNFEVSTAQELADNGFYVIVYDRRGEGRNQELKADFTFEQTFRDIDTLLKKHDINKVNLIGHSFGGYIATLYAKDKPEKVNSVILTSAPLSFQKSLKTILHSLKEIYQNNEDTVNQNYVSMIEKMDTTSLQYSGYIFMHAMANSSYFYTPKESTEKAKKIYSSLKNDSLIQKYGSQSNFQAPQGFWQNENYTSIDLTNDIKKLKENGIRIFGIFGKDDGLIPDNEIPNLKKLIGRDNVKYWENGSHNIFIDLQDKFIDQLKVWLK